MARGYLRGPRKKPKLTRKQREALPPEQRRKPGRPPGIHTPHRSPQERRAYLIERYGDPVEYMLMVMANNRNKIPRRDYMAVQAAPYVAQKMNQVTLEGGDADKPVRIKRDDLKGMSDAELAKHFSEAVRNNNKNKGS